MAERLEEKLQPNSPLFRIAFDPITAINRPKAITAWGIAKMVNKLLDGTGIRAPNEINQRT